MKTCCVTASISRKAGGLFQSVRHLHLEISRSAGVEVEVVALGDEFSAEDLPQWHPLSVQTLPIRGPRSFGYSSGFKPALDKGQYDLLHVHGIWMYPSCAALCWHRNTGRSHIISPRGMLDHWALDNSRWKKRIAGWLFENAHLREAACLHALCESEARAMRAYGLKNPIAIIPNGIDVPEVSSQKSVVNSQTSDLWPLASGKKVLLYLGRIHPKKGLVNLVRAWKKILNSQPSTNDWLLAIAGWDQGGHEAELKQLATELGITWHDVREHRTSNIEHRTPNVQHPTSNIWTPDARPPTSVVFLGPQFGDDKSACYRDCDAFILPSFSEGLPMVVLEAWAYGKPVLMTQECNLPEGFVANAAIRIEPSAESIARGLRELFQTPSAERQALGDNGRALVAEKFTWPKVAADMKSVYEWVLGGGIKPECVQTKNRNTES